MGPVGWLEGYGRAGLGWSGIDGWMDRWLGGGSGIKKMHGEKASMQGRNHGMDSDE